MNIMRYTPFRDFENFLENWRWPHEGTDVGWVRHGDWMPSVDISESDKEFLIKVEIPEVAKEDALANKWYRFLNDAQLEVCERGNRKKLGRCRETVEATVGTVSRRDRFAHCVRSGQAIPTVHELEKKAVLPDFAVMIDEEQKQTKGWYVLWCDPTLPELDDGQLETDRLPG